MARLAARGIFVVLVNGELVTGVPLIEKPIDEAVASTVMFSLYQVSSATVTPESAAEAFEVLDTVLICHSVSAEVYEK